MSARTELSLQRDGGGGYRTSDGRFTVVPVTMGCGVTGWAGGRGWSNGHREWEVTDTHGKARIGFNGRTSTIVLTVSEARGIIRSVMERS